MFINNIKLAYRFFKRQLGYTLLNMSGLILTLSSCLLILLYVLEETNYDKYHNNWENIYRISSDITESDNQFVWATTQLSLGPTLKNYFPGVKEYARFYTQEKIKVTNDINSEEYYESKLYFVDNSLFEIMTIDLLEGDKSNVFKDPNSVIISESTSNKIFGTNSPIGKSLKIDDKGEYRVTGVFKNMPKNSHLKANIFCPLESAVELSNEEWTEFNYYTFIRLNPDVRLAELDKSLEEINKTYVDPILSKYGIGMEYSYLRIADIHLKSTSEGEPEPLGDINYVYIFSIIGIFILIIGSINYTNMSVSQSIKRNKEVGIRKSLGGNRSSIIIQFLIESIAFTCISGILAILLMLSVNRLLEGWIGLQLNVGLIITSKLLAYYLIAIILIVLLGSFYPAIIISSYKPTEIIKGSTKYKESSTALSRVLITIQFLLAIVMITSTIVVFKQLSFLDKKSLGFDKYGLINFMTFNDSARKYLPNIKNEINQLSYVESVSSASVLPGDSFGKRVMEVENNEGSFEIKGVDFYRIENNYFKTLGIEYIDGRNFNSTSNSDTLFQILINESMKVRLGLKEPVGKRVILDDNYYTIIGVVSDFHQQSLYNPIAPLMFLNNQNNSSVLVRLNNVSSAGISEIESIWAKYLAREDFNYSFTENVFLEEYQADQIRGKLFFGFSILTLLLTFLGLFGLSSYAARRRSKELSIRKVLGANNHALIKLQVKSYVVLVLISMIPAIGISWIFLNNWLNNFEYHTSIGLSPFLIAIIITTVTVIITTGYHAIKATNSNPASVLKED
ncbi:MAG: ABC transporter permease [Fulvivirga sp.]|uniref:ABC transporter permease n=1 Tax=Fulvivirga sp. TaxID=1931237 RepID=UPI0032EBF17C